MSQLPYSVPALGCAAKCSWPGWLATSIRQRSPCLSQVVTVAFQMTGAVRYAYILSMADPMDSSREAEQLPRLTHRPLVPTCSVNHSYCTLLCWSTTKIWGDNILGLFLKDLLMYSGRYERLDNYCKNRCWFRVSRAVAGRSFDEGSDTTCVAWLSPWERLDFIEGTAPQPPHGNIMDS